MKLDTLDALKDDELQEVITRSQVLLKQRDEDRKAKALEQARATLAAVGLTLKDLNKAKPKAREHVYHGGRVYQHPSNKSLTWRGTGKKPGWLVDLEAEGGRAIEIVAANDDTPLSLKKTG